MKQQIREDYKNWLIALTNEWCLQHGGSYTQLMEYLFSREFYSIYANDMNRSQDGIEVRFRFIESFTRNNYTYRDVYNYLTHNCNMLEMMTALAEKCEDHIMGDPEIGDRSGEWFWGMLVNSGLDRLSDEFFDISEAERIVNNIIDHNYAKNGRGGLFSVRNPDIDMRYAELWYQMNWHLGELYDQY